MRILLNLLAAVALLVWGTHLVRAGILRIYGANLRRVLSRSVAHRFSAFFSGLAVTSLLQSSSATALITTSFVSQGLVALAPALVIMLGADVGSSLMAVVFAFDLSWLSPLLILVGVVMFLARQSSTPGRLGRVLIGFGLIIHALQMIVEATRPLTEAAGVKALLASLTGDPLLDLVVGALLALLFYSSLAVVLLTATLAASGLIALPVALGLVLGANLGSGLLAVISTLHTSREGRRLPLGNLLFKLTGCLLFIPLLGFIQDGFASFESGRQHVVVGFHLFFNVAMAALFLFFTEPIARIAQRLLPATRVADSPSQPRHLDAGALDMPAVAISCAAREALRIGDVVETMLAGMMTVLKTNDKELVAELRRLDDVVDDLYTATKLYLTQINREALAEAESRRWTEIISFTINMEQVGDSIERIIIDLKEKKIDKGRNFSEAGMSEICDMHARLIDNLRLGMSVFLNGDLKSAQRLLAQKVAFRELERAYAVSHLDRLSFNTSQSIETSAMHLDMITELKRINSHICSIAYPILEHAGVLSQSRLKVNDALADPVAGDAGKSRFGGVDPASDDAAKTVPVAADTGSAAGDNPPMGHNPPLGHRPVG